MLGSCSVVGITAAAVVVGKVAYGSACSPAGAGRVFVLLQGRGLMFRVWLGSVCCDVQGMAGVSRQGSGHGMQGVGSVADGRCMG